MHVAIIGNSINSNLGALYFRRRLPESTKITLIGPENRGGIPIVGESTMEITAQFLENQLGLGQYLRENHYPKYALTYYFKLDPDNPDDRRYSVHCNEREPADLGPLEGWEGPMARPPSWLINRSTFDRDLQKMVADEDGIEVIHGLISNIDINRETGHSLAIKMEDGNARSLKVDWVIDASGRRRLLARKFGLTIKPEAQRDCFWFRMADFDRSLIYELDALGPMPAGPGEPYHYDRYYSTHHFMGRGNWIWLIPLRTEDGSELISIGLTSRPDYYEHDVRSIDEFLEQVGKVHPVVTDFVKSGRILDTNILRRYHYFSEKVYSEDRWGIIGDAAFTPDPLFSNGLAFTTLQMEQLGEMIALDGEGELSAEYINALSEAFLAPVVTSQLAISDWYLSMHDAFLTALRLNWIEVSYFYILLPLIVNRCHYDPDRMSLWRVLQSGKNGFDIPKALLDARKLFDKPTPEHFIYQGKKKVNLRALEKVENLTGVLEQMKAGANLLGQYTADMLALVKQLEE